MLRKLVKSKPCISIVKGQSVLSSRIRANKALIMNMRKINFDLLLDNSLSPAQEREVRRNIGYSIKKDETFKDRLKVKVSFKKEILRVTFTVYLDDLQESRQKLYKNIIFFMIRIKGKKIKNQAIIDELIDLLQLKTPKEDSEKKLLLGRKSYEFNRELIDPRKLFKAFQLVINQSL